MKSIISVRNLVGTLCEQNPFLSFFTGGVSSASGKSAKLKYVKKIQDTVAKKLDSLSTSEKRFLEHAYKIGHKGTKTLALTDSQKYGSMKAYLEGANGIGRIKAQVKQYNALTGS